MRERGLFLFLAPIARLARRGLKPSSSWSPSGGSAAHFRYTAEGAMVNSLLHFLVNLASFKIDLHSALCYSTGQPKEGCHGQSSKSAIPRDRPERGCGENNPCVRQGLSE